MVFDDDVCDPGFVKLRGQQCRQPAELGRPLLHRWDLNDALQQVTLDDPTLGCGLSNGRATGERGQYYEVTHSATEGRVYGIHVPVANVRFRSKADTTPMAEMGPKQTSCQCQIGR